MIVGRQAKHLKLGIVWLCRMYIARLQPGAISTISSHEAKTVVPSFSFNRRKNYQMGVRLYETEVSNASKEAADIPYIVLGGCRALSNL